MIREWLRHFKFSTREAVFYVIVGIANSAAYFASAFILIELTRLPAFVAAGIAYIFSVIVSFLGNAIFTFESGRWNSLRQWMFYIGLYALGLSLNTSAVHIFDTLIGNPLVGVFAFGFSWPFIAFFISKAIVFKY